MSSCNIHFILKNKLSYKDLIPAFPKVLSIVLEENDHFQGVEGEDQRNMFLEMNMSDLRLNRKPEGYNRKGNYRMIFPIGEREFYISINGVKPTDIKRVKERVKERVEDALNDNGLKDKFKIVEEQYDD